MGIWIIHILKSCHSNQGLVDQLEYEGFSRAEAVYGVDNCGADWNEQAYQKALSYLDFTSFSKEGLIEQLEFEGFTHEQAVFGAEKCNMDLGGQALEKARSYLDFSAFSYTVARVLAKVPRHLSGS